MNPNWYGPTILYLRRLSAGPSVLFELSKIAKVLSREETPFPKSTLIIDLMGFHHHHHVARGLDCPIDDMTSKTAKVCAYQIIENK